MQYDAFFYCFYITIKAFSTDPVCCHLCQTEVPCYLACSGSRIMLGESSVSTNSSEDQEMEGGKRTENVCWALKRSDFRVACVTQSGRCFHIGVSFNSFEGNLLLDISNVSAAPVWHCWMILRYFWARKNQTNSVSSVHQLGHLQSMVQILSLTPLFLCCGNMVKEAEQKCNSFVADWSRVGESQGLPGLFSSPLNVTGL